MNRPILEMDMDSRVRRSGSDRFVYVEVDDELVFMDVGKGTFYSLKEAGIRCWRLIDGGGCLTVGALVQGLREEYEVDEETCRRDLSVLLDELAAVGLVDVGCEAPQP